MTIRTPFVAGQFYAGDNERLTRQITRCFENHEFGPGKLPETIRKKKIVSGIIVPHAGYMYSGAGQAWCYNEIAEAKVPDVFIILGVNHSAQKTCSSDDDWETPLGIMKTDQELVKKIEEKGLPIDNDSHIYEHSIEIQLPFLQFATKNVSKNIKILAIMIANDDYEKWGKIIKESLEESKKTATIICSSDFTHYGTDYDYIPFDKPEKNMKKFDIKAIETIKNTDTKGLLSYCEETRATICGKNGIGVMLWLLKNHKVKLLNYYTSAEVIKNWSNAVGYASILRE